MNKEMMLQAMNDLDEADILDAAPLTGAAKDRAIRRRWVRVAVIAACLVIVLGTVTYATGFLSKTVYGPVYESNLHYISDDGEEKDIKMIYADAYVPTVKPDQIKGRVNELKSVIKDNILASRKGKFIADPPNTREGAPEAYYVNGLTQEEAVNYIGYEYLEPTWFPYENSVTYVEVIANLNDLSKCDFRSINIDTFNYTREGILSPEGLEGRLFIRTEVFLVIDEYEETFATGAFGGFADSTYYEIVSPSGVKCYVSEVSEEYMPDPCMAMGAQVIKNDIVYRISIDYSKNNQDEARRIIREWAEHF